MAAWTTFIYLLLDTKTMTGYVGKSDDPWSRARVHWLSRFDEQQTPKRDWLKSLKMPPQLIILQRCTENNWSGWEKIWIRDMGLGGLRLKNLHPGGRGGALSEESQKKQAVSLRTYHATHSHCCLGRHLTEEHKQSLRVAQTGRKKSREERLKLSKANKGKKRSKASRRRISLGLMGRPVSEETREKMSLAKQGYIPWNKGRPWTDEEKANIGEGQRQRYARKKSEQHPIRYLF